MFSKIRNRLTFVYTIVLALFLSLFAISSLSLLIYSFANVEIDGMVQYVSHEAEEYLLEGEYPATDEEISSGQMLFFITNSREETIIDKLSITPIGLNLITSPYKLDIANSTSLIYASDEIGKPLLYISTKSPLFKDNLYVGTLTMFKNISQYYTIIFKFMLLSLLLIFCFLVLSIILGYFIAQKNIYPLKKSFEQQQDFVSNVSHEIYTPLSVILLSAESLELESKNIFTPDSALAIKTIKEEVLYLNRLTRSLLQLSSLDSNKNTLTLITLDVKDLLSKLKPSFEKLAEKKAIEITFNITKEKLPVKIDPDKLTQVLNILVDNAIKYSDSNTTIIIGAQKHNYKTIAITVTDQGCGIENTHLEKIFNRFFRADDSRTRQQEGFGLGLSIAKMIILAHAGEIVAENCTNTGSKFTILLPLDSFFH